MALCVDVRIAGCTHAWAVPRYPFQRVSDVQDLNKRGRLQRVPSNKECANTSKEGRVETARTSLDHMCQHECNMIAHVYIRTYVHTYVCTYAHTHIHTYTYTCTHTHIDISSP